MGRTPRRFVLSDEGNEILRAAGWGPRPEPLTVVELRFLLHLVEQHGQDKEHNDLVVKLRRLADLRAFGS